MVGKTPAALYERQRVLMEAGLLQAVAGRGPGSGVRATPQSMAALLIALLATETVAETGERTAAVMKLKSASDTKRCPITGKKTFAEALTAILASEELARQIEFFEVGRSGEKAGACIFRKGESYAGVDGTTFGVRHGAGAVSQFGSGLLASAGQGLGIQARLSLPFDQIAHALTGTETKEPNK
jgi:hypothetical protein